MAIVGFRYVQGPVYLREFTLASTATFKELQPVIIDSNGSIIESLSTVAYVTGFAAHSAANSTPAGKVLVYVPTERAIFESVVTSTVTASVVASGKTGFHVKSGNSFYFVPSGVSATASNLYTIVPREDGSTLNSADSTVLLMVNGAAILPFNQSGTPVK